MTPFLLFQKPELDNINIRQQNSINNAAGMSQPPQFIKTEDGGSDVVGTTTSPNMAALSPLSGADLNLSASR